MTTPFTFVPRALSKYTKEWQGISRRPPSPSPPPDPTTDDDDCEDSEHEGKGKGKEKDVAKQTTITQDIATLISLALSDYNVWLDPDLRWKLEATLLDDTSPDDAGFVPINYLLRRTPFRGSLPQTGGQSEPSETEVVKAIRAQASHALEVRMRLASSSSVWYGTGKTSRKKDVGGYEVRRRDWARLATRPSRGWSSARWDDMTAYLECIPPQYRTVGAIARFAESLLSETERDADQGRPLCVQCITLPPHYLDKPGDLPKCKGYALVTFSTISDLEAVLGAWPWKRCRELDDDDGNASPFAKEAHKYGLRAISKTRWDALNDEYLLYKQSLVKEMAHVETELQQGRRAPSHDYEGDELDTETQTQKRTTHSSPYPFDCLVFVRNVHPDTNKTMLKSFFSQAFQDEDGIDAGRGHGHTATASGLDYVDFNKGMDACYLRLASPDHATRLIAYFDARPTSQVHGLDATGRSPLEGDKPVVMEKVQGKKEEVYWEKIPEKVRRQAVDKVVQAELTSGAGSSVGASGSRRTPSAKKRLREC